MTDFTPFNSLAGGLLIGFAAVLLMLGLGRIMGATGILTGLLFPSSTRDWLWRVAFLLGAICAPWFILTFTHMPIEISFPTSKPAILIGGFLVGIGVTLGSGCTSGHGICGLARLSKRSLIAVPIFMVSAIITVFITRHLLDIS